MKRYSLIVIISLLFSCKEKTENKNIVYLSPDCGCCHDWVIHMEKNDFPLEKNMDSNMYDIKINAGLPIDLASCHTAMISGYFIEGHVPASDVKRLIEGKSQQHNWTNRTWNACRNKCSWNGS